MKAFTIIAAFSILVTAIVAANTFCRCENQKDLSYLIFSITDDIKQEFHTAVPDAKYSRLDCSFCSKVHCQYQFNKQLQDDGNTGENIKKPALLEITVDCFKRESKRDQFIIYGFLSLVFGLLAYAVYSNYR